MSLDDLLIQERCINRGDCLKPTVMDGTRRVTSWLRERERVKSKERKATSELVVYAIR
jgi:hypothetical protein